MKTEKDFAAQVAADETAKQHSAEIQKTRIGGLGGSDAAMVLKIGQKGMASLSATDNKRIAIMLGLLKQDDWGGNVYTKAGHDFEDFAERNLPLGNHYEREKVMSQPLALNFKTFTHADFVIDDTEVVECKFAIGTTEATAAKYAAQLQWYYLMGATSVTLYHGVGQAEPFEVYETDVTEIDRDEETLKCLVAGIKTLDDAISKGWQPELTDKCEYGNTPEIVRDAFDKLASIKNEEKSLADKKAEVISVLKAYCEDFNFSNIKNEFTGAQVIYTKAGVSRTFDVKKFATEHPEIDLEAYYKTTNRAASITFKS